eukprot:gene9309-19323_t
MFGLLKTGNVFKILAITPYFRCNSTAMDALNSTLIITKSCAERIASLRKTLVSQNSRLRVAVEGGGCSGFQYKFKMDDTSDNEDLIFRQGESEVIVDPTSFELLRGATIDFEQELIRSAFAVVNNPNSESACGCGSSFAVKAFSSNPALD